MYMKPFKFPNTITTTTMGDIASWDIGSGDTTLLFLHGNSLSKDVFVKQLSDPIFSHYRLIAIDFLGHGHSSDSRQPEKDYNLPAMADSIRQVLQHKNISSPIVFGWSLGGHVALEMAGQNIPMKGIALTGTPPAGPGSESMQAAYSSEPHAALIGQLELNDEQIQLFISHALGSKESIPEHIYTTIKRADGLLRENILHHWLQSIGGFNQPKIVAKWAGPIAVIQGENESFFSNDYLNTLSWNNLWQNKVQLVSNAGHAPFWERPKKFNDLLLRFITDCT